MLGLSLTIGSSGNASPLEYILDLTLDPGNSRLSGMARLVFSSEKRNIISLMLDSGCTVQSVTKFEKAIKYRQAGNYLIIELAGDTEDELFEIVVSYTAVFNDQPPANPIHNEDPTYGVSAIISTKGTFLSGAAGWYPLLLDEPALYRVRIETPLGYIGVTSGRLVASGESESAAFFLWQTETPLQALSLAAGPYLIKKELADTIPIYSYFYPQSQDLADTYLLATRHYLELYQNLFGRYPFEKFAIVENFFPTGYGFPSWTLLGSSVVRLPFIVETSLGHEIAHSWWGTGVMVDTRYGNWAEGLTTYLADHLYKERESADAGAEYRLKILRDYATLVSIEDDFALAQFGSRDSKASQSVGYGKGAMLFHMLRKKIGEAAFWAGLRKVVEQKMFRKAAWSDFRQAFESTSGADLKPFFKQWIEHPGAPVLELSGVSVAHQGDTWQVIGTILQRGKPYVLSVPVRIKGVTDSVDQIIECSAAKTPFVFTLPWSPRRIVIDPDIDIFRRLSPEEIPPTVNGVRGSDNLLVIVSDALPEPVQQAALDLVSAFRQDQAKVISESAVSNEQLQNHDLLLIGLPTRAKIRPLLAEGLLITDQQFVVAGDTFNNSSADLFAALPHPYKFDLNCALFLPASAESAKVASRKIPHYGKYSYLVFEQGNNRLKGTWTPSSSAMIHEFTSYE